MSFLHLEVHIEAHTTCESSRNMHKAPKLECYFVWLEGGFYGKDGFSLGVIVDYHCDVIYIARSLR